MLTSVFNTSSALFCVLVYLLKMELFYVIICVSFLNQFIQNIVTFIISRLLGSSGDVNNSLKRIKEMMNELSSISMTDEWARYAKLQRKINKENEQFSKLRNDSSEIRDKAITSVTRICHILLALTMTYTVFNYRSTVVAQVPENWFWPFQYLLCWSKDIPGGITVPCWIIISSSFFRTTSKIFS